MPRYLPVICKTIENAAIWAQIGDKMVTVGNIRAGQIIAVEPTSASYYAFNFGFGKGFIDKGHLEPVRGDKKLKRFLVTSTSR
ncbi:hypothetical protein ACLB1M_04305 [Escherichia coli]